VGGSVNVAVLKTAEKRSYYAGYVEDEQGKKTMKPKMYLRTEDDAYSMINRAALILSLHNMPKQGMDILQRACIEGYDFHIVLKLLKEYMTI